MRYAYKMNQYNFAYNSVMVKVFESAHAFFKSIYAGGPFFGPVKYVKEVIHVKHMHANSLLVHPNFFSKLTIT